MIGTTAANSRQLLHRAKARVAEGRPRVDASAAEKRELVGRFVTALRDVDPEAMAGVLADDVGFWGDGGGKALAARRPVFGRGAVLNLLMGIRRTAPSAGVPLDSISLDIIDVNYEPALVIRVAGQIDSVYACAIVDGAISAIRVVRNPEKLAFLQRQLSAG